MQSTESEKYSPQNQRNMFSEYGKYTSSARAVCPGMQNHKIPLPSLSMPRLDLREFLTKRQRQTFEEGKPDFLCLFHSLSELFRATLYFKHRNVLAQELFIIIV